MKILTKNILILMVITGLFSCKKFLDIVPDDVATIENAFTLRTTAKKYLYGCYSYISFPGSETTSPSFMRGDMWPLGWYNDVSTEFVKDGQNVVNPLMNFWEGLNGGKNLFQAIRDCNIFLENIEKVPDLETMERNQWIGEVKVLKGLYHFELLRLYGPIPFIKTNLAIDAGTNEVRLRRMPIDVVIENIVQLFDEAIPDLPAEDINLTNRQEYGRINAIIAKALKAKVLVTAASPLYNGNTDWADYIDDENGPLFNTAYSAEKWEKAMNSAKDAIDAAEAVGVKLYEFQPGVLTGDISPFTMTKLSLRNAFSTRDFNYEAIWAYTNGFARQSALTPRSWDPDRQTPSTSASQGPSLDVLDRFNTINGVPMEDDKNWNYEGRYNLLVGDASHKLQIKEGYTTVSMHFDREPRFYSSVGFDGGIWYGQGRYDENNSFWLNARPGGHTYIYTSDAYVPTGMFTKKNINYQNEIDGSNVYQVNSYLFPMIRLADLYLLYSEAVNEFNGPIPEAFKYLNKVRARAGIPSVEDAWTQYAKRPDYYKTKEGLREIIRRERSIELVFESQNYWDMLRWKTAEIELNKPIEGWNLQQKDAAAFYQPTFLYQRRFRKRDYFVPIREIEFQKNRNIMQSPGW